MRSRYWGTADYLSAPQKQELFGWLDQQDAWTLEEVIDHIEDEYTVVYQSLQSYYSLLKQAGFSWKKAQCHLLWGDFSGYSWSRRKERVDVDIQSTKQRQTYYGALDYLTKSFVVHEYSAGNEDNTVAFLKYLQSLSEDSTRLVIIWDGAMYHRSAVTG